MVYIKICVGSSCYLKGAQKIIDQLEEFIKENDAYSQVELSGAFCLGNCGDGIAISINDEILHIATPEEAKILLEKYITGE